MLKAFKNLLCDDSGVTLIEYALIGVLIAVALVGVLGVLSGNLQSTFTTVGTKI